METFSKLVQKFKGSSWQKKVGILGFTFFLVKGLVWVGLGIILWLGLK